MTYWSCEASDSCLQTWDRCWPSITRSKRSAPKAGAAQSSQHCPELQPVAWKVAKRINFPSVNFPFPAWQQWNIVWIRSQVKSQILLSTLQDCRSARAETLCKTQASSMDVTSSCGIKQNNVVAWNMEQRFDCQENARAGVLKFKDISRPSSTGRFIQRLTLCAFLCILHALQSSWNNTPKRLSNRKTMNTQMHQDPKDWHVKGRCHNVARWCTPNLAGSYGIEHALQRRGLRYSQLTSAYRVLDLWQSYRFDQIHILEAAFDTVGYQGARIKPTSRWLREHDTDASKWELNIMKGLQWFSHIDILSPKHAWIFNIHSMWQVFKSSGRLQ